MGARFQVLFHSPPGVLFTFPSRYWCAIGHRVVLRLGWWSTQVRTGFHVPGPTQGPRRAVRSGFAYGAVTRCGRPPMPFRSPAGPAPGGGSPRMRGPATPSAEPLPGMPARRFGHRSPFARRYSGSLEIDFLSSGYLDVSVPRVVLPTLCVRGGDMHTAVHGFAHSETPGSKDVCSSPGIIAACRVLHRLPVPSIRRAPVVSCGTASGPRDIHVSLMKINRYHE